MNKLSLKLNFLLGTLFFLLSTMPVLAKDLPHAKVIRVHDGDTFTISLPKEYTLFGDKISVRVYGIDAPEIHGIQPCEKEKALAAKKLAESLLLGKDVTLKNVKHDKYFRLLAEAWIGNQSLSQILLEKKLAYSYFGKTKEKKNWCMF